MSRLLKNLRRASHYIPNKTPKCLACGQRQEWLGRLPGEAPRGSLIDENFKVGLCSWRCWCVFYGMISEDGRRPLCRCGTEVSTPGAQCLDCSRSRRKFPVNEDSRYIYCGFRRFTNGLVSPP